MKEFIENMSDDERLLTVKNILESMFKQVEEVVFIERKEFNIPGLERSVYWTYGFRLEFESWKLQAATIDNTGAIDLRFHRINVKNFAPQKEVFHLVDDPETIETNY